MNKILRYGLILFSFATLLTACKQVEPTDANQILLANKDWHTEGLYFGVAADGTGGSKVLAPKLKFKFAKTSLLNTTTVNDQNLGAAAVWTLSVDAKSLTVYYPSLGGATGVTLASQVLKVVKLTATELWVTTPTTEDIQLFGIINLSPTSNYRFTTIAPATVTPLNEEALLKGATWTGTGDTAGIWTGISPNFTKTGNAAITFEFKVFYGLNYVSISGLPTPATWMLNTPTTLTIAYPKVGTVPAKAFNLTIAELTASKLTFSATEALTFSSVVSLPVGAQLRLIPKP